MLPLRSIFPMATFCRRNGVTGSYCPFAISDRAVNTPRGPVRVPTVIIAVNYARVPLRRPRFGARGIWERDGGVCQYTGRKLDRKEGNIDHVVPRSRGGKTSWDNCVLAHREINSAKAIGFPTKLVRLRNRLAALSCLTPTKRQIPARPEWMMAVGVRATTRLTRLFVVEPGEVAATTTLTLIGPRRKRRMRATRR